MTKKSCVQIPRVETTFSCTIHLDQNMQQI